MKKSRLKKIIKENLNQNSKNLNIDLSNLYKLEDDEGTKLAEKIDRILVNENYDGSWEEYEDDGGEDERDEILYKFTKISEIKLKGLIENYLK